MKIKFENLGYIDSGEITPGNLTIIAGNNNLGKTYINYVVYGLLLAINSRGIFDIENSSIEDLINKRTLKIDIMNYEVKIGPALEHFSSEFSKGLNQFFSSNEDAFHNTKVSIEPLSYINHLNNEFNTGYKIGNTVIDVIRERDSNIIEFLISVDSKEEGYVEELPEMIVKDIISRSLTKSILTNYFKIPFIITSERTGVSLFYKELDINKNALIEQIAKAESINPLELILGMTARYALPIKHNIDAIRDLDNILKNKSLLLKENKENYQIIMSKLSQILNGNFEIVNKQIVFKSKKERGRKQVELIPIYLTSSATKSLLLLDIYLKSYAQPNRILLIDEPELNLHPSNQIIMARLLANLVNCGIDVMITTHSDYIIKEFNNLIMLNNKFEAKERILKEYKYEEFDIINPEKVKVYFVDNHKIIPANIDEFGIELKLFDKTIVELNQKSNDIYYSLEEK